MLVRGTCVPHLQGSPPGKLFSSQSMNKISARKNT